MNGFWQSCQRRRKRHFCKTLDTLYWRSKRQSRAGFPDVSALIDKGGEGREE